MGVPGFNVSRTMNDRERYAAITDRPVIEKRSATSSEKINPRSKDVLRPRDSSPRNRRRRRHGALRKAPPRTAVCSRGETRSARHRLIVVRNIVYPGKPIFNRPATALGLGERQCRDLAYRRPALNDVVPRPAWNAMVSDFKAVYARC